jgi:hypothetical protein
MEAMLILVVFAIVALVGAAAQNFGVDSREIRDNQTHNLGVR